MTWASAAVGWIRHLLAALRHDRRLTVPIVELHLVHGCDRCRRLFGHIYAARYPSSIDFTRGLGYPVAD